MCVQRDSIVLTVSCNSAAKRTGDSASSAKVSEKKNRSQRIQQTVVHFVHPLSLQSNGLPSINLSQEVSHPRDIALYLNAGTLLAFDSL
jgi:hypothetical protein